jgi:hypothetical protein
MYTINGGSDYWSRRPGVCVWGAASTIQRSPHLAMASSTGSSLRPAGVKRYLISPARVERWAPPALVPSALYQAQALQRLQTDGKSARIDAAGRPLQLAKPERSTEEKEDLQRPSALKHPRDRRKRAGPGGRSFPFVLGDCLPLEKANGIVIRFAASLLSTATLGSTLLRIPFYIAGRARPRRSDKGPICRWRPARTSDITPPNLKGG